MLQSFEFVLSGDPGRLEGSRRDLIRSHCMKGRNRRPGSRRSLREARRAASSQPIEIEGGSRLLFSNIITPSRISHTTENSEQASAAYQNQIVIPGRANEHITPGPPFSPHPKLRLDCLGMKPECEYWQLMQEC
jgi:hypothetical protein